MKREIGLIPRAGLFIALASLCAAATVAISRGLPSHRTKTATATATKTAATMPRPVPASDTDGAEDPPHRDLRGQAAPPFTLSDTHGNRISLTRLKGHSVLLNFWATFCEPCQSEMPSLEALGNQYKDRGLVILGIDQEERLPQGEIGRAAKRLGVTYPILLPDTTISQRYGGVDYLPETFYIDRNGTIVAQTTGLRTRSQMEQHILTAIASGA